MEETIKADNLSKSYADMIAVKNVSISVGRGEIFGLLGANGAGKSTPVECILGAKKQDMSVMEWDIVKVIFQVVKSDMVCYPIIK